MTVYGFDKQADADGLLEMLRRGEDPRDAPEPDKKGQTQYRPNATNARWFAKTPSDGISAFDVGAEFDDGGGSSFTDTVPSATCKLYIVSTNAAGTTITIERWLAPDGTHAEALIGNLLTDAIDGDVLIGVNRAVGGALIADHGSCGDG